MNNSSNIIHDLLTTIVYDNKNIKAIKRCYQMNNKTDVRGYVQFEYKIISNIKGLNQCGEEINIKYISFNNKIQLTENVDDFLCKETTVLHTKNITTCPKNITNRIWKGNDIKGPERITVFVNLVIEGSDTSLNEYSVLFVR